MKLLWHSNAPFAPTGYGQQTGLFAPRLRDAGHDLAISAFWGLNGAPLDWDDIRLYPGFRDPFGNDIIEGHAAQHFGDDPRAGLVFTLIDAWVLSPQVYGKLRTASWTPVDHEPVPAQVVEFFRQSGAVPVAMSRHGQRELEAAGLDPLYVPHGVDTTVYKPEAKDTARQRVGLPADAFIVGMVAANKDDPSRKCFPEALRAFAEVRETHEDAFLYLHTEAFGLNGGINLTRLLEALKIPPAAVRFPHQYRYLTGQISPQEMAALYASMDVMLNPAAGEGFGVPILEAQACGTPVIVSDHSAMREVGETGWHVSVEPQWTPQGSWWGRPSHDELVWALGEAHARAHTLTEQAVAHAAQYDADLVMAEHMLAALEQAWQRTEPPAYPVAVKTDGPSVTVVTPWWNHPELAPDYWKAIDHARLVPGDRVLIVDNASSEPAEHPQGASILRQQENLGFQPACNLGAEAARSDVVLFLNNDIRLARPGWLDQIRAACKPGTLVGAQLRDEDHAAVDGVRHPYLDGWCLAIRKSDLMLLGGWDEHYEEPSYYGDNDLCLRARAAGMELVQVDVGLEHIGTYSNRAFDLTKVTARNQERYRQRARDLFPQAVAA